MDEINLAQMMIDYSNKRKELNALEDQIKQEVLALQKSFKIGDVSAVYYGESVTTDYEGAARVYGASADVIAKNTHITETISWKGVCESIFITPGDSFKTVKPARVVVK